MSMMQKILSRFQKRPTGPQQCPPELGSSSLHEERPQTGGCCPRRRRKQHSIPSQVEPARTQPELHAEKQHNIPGVVEDVRANKNDQESNPIDSRGSLPEKDSSSLMSLIHGETMSNHHGREDALRHSSSRLGLDRHAGDLLLVDSIRKAFDAALVAGHFSSAVAAVAQHRMFEEQSVPTRVRTMLEKALATGALAEAIRMLSQQDLVDRYDDDGKLGDVSPVKMPRQEPSLIVPFAEKDLLEDKFAKEWGTIQGIPIEQWMSRLHIQDKYGSKIEYATICTLDQSRFPLEASLQDDSALLELTSPDLECCPGLAMGSAADRDAQALSDLLNPREACMPTPDQDDTALLDLVSPGYTVSPAYKVEIEPGYVPTGQGWWPRNSTRRVHPDPHVFAPSRKPHHSQPQRMYLSAQHMDAPSIANHFDADNYSMDIDSWRDEGPVRHRIVQRISVDGQQVGPLKVERLVARGHANRAFFAGPCPLPDLTVGGWSRLCFNSATEMKQDLQLVLGSDGVISVGGVAAGGLSQRSGVFVGYQLQALNGSAYTLHERLDALLMHETNEPFTLDLRSPTMNCHGIPSFGDVSALAPLLAPELVNYAS